MREAIAAACGALALLVVTAPGFGADTAKPADPAFKLLELGGRKVRWTVPSAGLPAKVSYAFLTAPAQFPGERNCDAMLPAQAALDPSKIAFEDFRREVRTAFSAWETAANIIFEETQSVVDAGILIGADAKARGRAFTNVALRDRAASAPASAAGAIRQSLICFNPQQPWKIGFDGNLEIYDVRFTMLHEIGHAIGLDHPSPVGQLMSFRYVEASRDLQQGDVAGAVALYGRAGAATAPNLDQTPTRAAQGNRPLSGDASFGIGGR